MEWDGTLGSIKEVATNNLYYYIQEFIVAHSASLALLVIGLFLAFMTFLKTGAYFLSSATIIPIRTGIVRDIRNQLYQKITSLSLGFFSEERKGDIIAHHRHRGGELFECRFCIDCDYDESLRGYSGQEG